MKEDEMKKPVILYYIGVISLFILLCLVGLVSFWLYYPYETVTHTHDPWEIETPVVIAGETALIHLDACRNTKISPRIHRSLVDGFIINYPVVEGASVHGLIGCYNHSVGVTIPEYVPSGTYHFVTVLEYNMNPLRTIRKTYKTEEFTIIGIDD